MIKNLTGALLCGAAAAYLATSDALINSSAAQFIGSTEDARLSAEYVAKGVVIALLALGSVMRLIKDDFAKLGAGSSIVLATMFSFSLTVMGASIDFQANESADETNETRQKNNNNAINELKSTKIRYEAIIDECERDNFYTKQCNKTLDLLPAVDAEIMALLSDSNSAATAGTFTIADAIETKSGLSGETLQSISIYTRAVVVPLMLAILTWGFWGFWDELIIDIKRHRGIAPKKHKSGAGSSKTGPAATRYQSKTLPKPKKLLLNPVNSSKTKKTGSSSARSAGSSSNLKPKKA